MAIRDFVNKINPPTAVKPVAPAAGAYTPNTTTGQPGKPAAPEYSVQPVQPVAPVAPGQVEGANQIVKAQPSPRQHFNQSVAQGFTNPGDVNEAAYSSPTPKHKGFFRQ